MQQQRVRLASLRVAVIGACALSATLAVSGTAMAQSAHRAGSARRHVSKVHFALNGIVESKSGSVVKLYVQNGHVGRKKVRRVMETVTLQRRHARTSKGRAKTPVVGDILHVNGTDVVSGDSSTLSASNDAVVPAQSTAVVGTVVSVSGTTVVLTAQALANGDSSHASDGNLSVDASQATVTIDGSSGSVAQLVTGETVAAIGEKDDGGMVAAALLGYSVTPGVAAGSLTSVSGSVLTLSSGDGSGDAVTRTGSKDATSSTSVDASTATIYLNGVSGAALSQLSTGDSVIAIGTAGTSPLAATTVLDFNSGDNNPTGDNTGDQGDS